MDDLTGLPGNPNRAHMTPAELRTAEMLRLIHSKKARLAATKKMSLAGHLKSEKFARETRGLVPKPGGGVWTPVDKEESDEYRRLAGGADAAAHWVKRYNELSPEEKAELFSPEVTMDLENMAARGEYDEGRISDLVRRNATLAGILAGETAERDKPNRMLGAHTPNFYHGANRFPTGAPVKVWEAEQRARAERSKRALEIAEEQMEEGTRNYFRPENIDEDILFAAREAWDVKPGVPVTKEGIAERMNIILAAGPGHEDWWRMARVRDEYDKEDTEGRTRSRARAYASNVSRKQAEENLAAAREARMETPRGHKITQRLADERELQMMHARMAMMTPAERVEALRGANAVGLAEAQRPQQQNDMGQLIALMMAMNAGGGKWTKEELMEMLEMIRGGGAGGAGAPPGARTPPIRFPRTPRPTRPGGMLPGGIWGHMGL